MQAHIMIKKRRRELKTVDVQKVEIYEDLSNFDESVRLKAAQALLTNFVIGEKSTGHELNAIIRRLLRGLCSGRKAARLGFSVALTESLHEIYGQQKDTVTGVQGVAELLETLKAQSSTIGSLSGQVRQNSVRSNCTIMLTA